MPRKDQGQTMAEPEGSNGSGENGAMRIDPALVRELAQLLTDNELTEIEVQDGDRRIKVQRNPAALAVAPAPPSAVAPAPAAAPAAAPAEPVEEITGFT